jgi:hypothetical protein
VKGGTPRHGDDGASGSDGFRDAERRASVASLAESYIEARDRVPSGAPHGNLDWILGPRRNSDRDPIALEPGTVRLMGLWLQDLAADLEARYGSGRPEPIGDATPMPAESLAATLRGATRRFLTAFRRPR